jgi:pyruvate formate lyase activating enzyme
MMRQDPECPTGLILEIQRMSTEDGPGLRTTVFFKGCSLRCPWCHNPESIAPQPQAQWLESRCIGCKTCLDACPEQALSRERDGISIDRAGCRGCGACADECPSAALEILGRTWALEALIREVLKDQAYFESSGGGITLAGGEPTLQARFARAFLEALQRAGVHTAVDTCGMCGSEALKQLLPVTDLLLFDLKAIDPLRHAQLTGSSNEQILKNLLAATDSGARRGRPKELWIRTPIIPGATATEENVTEIGKFLASNLDGAVSRWDLCAFNNLCRDKYTRLGMEWEFADCELLTDSFMERIAVVARESGVDPSLVHWDGPTRSEVEPKNENRL